MSVRGNDDINDPSIGKGFLDVGCDAHRNDARYTAFGERECAGLQRHFDSMPEPWELEEGDIPPAARKVCCH